MAWTPAVSRIYGFKPQDFMDLTPEQVKMFEKDEPQPMF